jgi:peptidoglycan/xylan/chitin deacetylase (PgdA/CDA1 family)
VRVSAGLHLTGGLVCVVSPRSWPWVVGGLVADHAVLVAGSLLPRSTLVGPNLRRLPMAPAFDGKVALTFDDGPDPVVTPRVLARLDERGVHATFFCIGRRAEEHPGLVAEIARRGHRVENHSYRHSAAFCFFGPGAIGRELDRAQDALTRHAGSAPRWFRAPAGLRNPWLDAALPPRGLELASWTRRAFDTLSSEPATVVHRLTRGLAARDVLVLHDGGSAISAGGAPVVLEALPRLLDAIDAAGLSVIPLPPPVRQASSVA